MSRKVLDAVAGQNRLDGTNLTGCCLLLLYLLQYQTRDIVIIVKRAQYRLPEQRNCNCAHCDAWSVDVLRSKESGHRCADPEEGLLSTSTSLPA